MPLQEFWYDDPVLLWVYRNSYIEKQKQELETQKHIINFQAWLQGYYNYVAIENAFSKNGKYLSEPINFNPKTEKEKKLEVAKKIKERAMKGKAILDKQRRENKE